MHLILTMSNTKSIVLAFSSLMVGCIIYLLFRQDILAVHWIGNPKWIEPFRINIGYDGNLLTYILLYCLPDALWFFSFLLFEFILYDKSIILCRILLYSTIAIPFLLETLQYCKIIGGTFDILDVISYLTALLIVLIIEKYEKK